MAERDAVLVSWVAVNNDPYERARDGSDKLDSDGRVVPGPSLTLLFDEASAWRGRIAQVHLFYRDDGGKAPTRERLAQRALVDAIHERDRSINVRSIPWQGQSPIDHAGILAFLRARIPGLRRRADRRELVVHVSPGTPAMHTVWVLLGATGFIDPPFRLVQTIPTWARGGGGAAVVDVTVDIETYLRRYRGMRPAVATEARDELHWDPHRLRSTTLTKLFEQARRVARLNVPVLIRGERGTGKTTLANWIRAASPFRQKEKDAAWASLACGQFSADALAAELFGVAEPQGRALADEVLLRESVLSQAHRDSLFLDEIGDLSPDLQRALIRVLEEKRFVPVGGRGTRVSDFRLLCATNLPWSVLAERLSPDLLDRISPFQLVMPPLREVPEELDWLWPLILERAAERARVAPLVLSEKEHAKVVARLKMHPLPGNLRDLYRVALHLLAARGDSEESARPTMKVAMDDAFRALPELPTEAGLDLPRSLASAFADRRPLDELVPPGGRLDTERSLGGFRQWIARELSDLARRRGVPTDALADVSDRTLRNWRSWRPKE